MKTLITFALIDDKPSELTRMVQHIEQLPKAKVVCQARNSEQLQAQLNQIDKLPTFILVDIKIGTDFKKGYRIVDDLYRQYPSVHLILVSEYPDTTYLKEVIAKGSAKGFIAKDNFAFGLHKAIKKIKDRGEYWDEAPKDSYIHNYHHVERESERRLKEEKHWFLSADERKQIKKWEVKTTPAEVKTYKPQCFIQLESELTVQQWIIFKYIAMGHSPKAIAAMLDTSADTINSQKRRIKEQMEIEGYGEIYFLLKALSLGVLEVRTFIEQETGITIID